MKTISAFLAAFLITTAAYSQSKTTAAAEIETIKNGALFIRLKTNENYINTLIRQGNKQAAENMRIQQEKDNKAMAAAFHDNVDFCKVYFFYSKYSAKIEQGKYKGYLMNSNLEKDTTYTGDFLIGEFGESETSKIQAFLFEDKHFKQLKSPFPFMIRLNRNGVIERTKPEMTVLINKELHSFYDDVQLKK